MNDRQHREMLHAHDYYRAAQYLIRKYGAEAGDRAAMRAARLAADGFAEIHAMWRLLTVTVREIEDRGRR